MTDWQVGSLSPGSASPTAEGFSLTTKLGVCFLVVFPPSQRGGQPVSLEDVMAAIAKWPIDEINVAVVERVIARANGNYQRFGRIKLPYTAHEAPFAVTLAPDRLTAYVLPWAENPVQFIDPEDVRTLLNRVGVKHGIDEQALVGLIAQPLTEPTPTAFGELPTPGRPAELLYAVPLLVDDKPKIDGVSVRAGTVLAHRIPSEPGKPGIDVTGEMILPPEIEDAQPALLAGEGTNVEADHDRIVAANDGIAIWRGWRDMETGKVKSEIVVLHAQMIRRKMRGHPNGYFELRCERGNVSLLVDAPGPGGKPVDLGSVKRLLKPWPLDQRDDVLVAKTVKAGQWTPSLIGQIAPQHIAPDESFALKREEQSETVYAFPWDQWPAPPVNGTEMRKALKALDINYGLLDDKLNALERGPWRRPVVVARLGQVRVRAVSIEDALAQGAPIIGADQTDLEVTVERTESSGLLGLGKEIIHALVRGRKKPLPPENGTCEVRCSRGVCTISVTSPRHGGERVALDDAMVEMRKWPFDFDTRAIHMAVVEANGVPRKVADIEPHVGDDPGCYVPDDSPVAVTLSADKSQAYLITWGQFPAEVSVENAKAALERVGVVAGIDEAELARVAERPLRRPVVVARSQPATRGQDARFEFLFDAISYESAESMERLAMAAYVGKTGQAQFRDLVSVPSVQPGTVLGRKRPRTAGKNGCTIMGETLIAEPGDDIDIRTIAGEGTEAGEDGLGLRASVEGQPTRVGDKIAVIPIRTVDGNVDYSTGNIDFDGHVNVEGNVYPGFRVPASNAVYLVTLVTKGILGF